MRLAKISVLGAGNVGGSTAAAIATRRLGEVFLYDAVDGLAEGKAMDISHAAAHFHSISPIRGCEDLDELDGTDVFVISAGSPRKAGMTRADLLESNLQVLRELCNALLPASPDATVLIITNPVDVLTAHVAREWPERTILGLGCSLDTVRLQYFLAA
ncbi:MAG: lactate/malate family dehydrogenase, partial [Phycisphaerae bacterium]